MGFLKDGIQTWVPKAITDIFGTTPALSVFLTAALPLINTIGVFAVKLMQRWKKEEDLLYTAILFGGAGVILALVAALLEVSAVLTVALFSLASAGVFGVSTALTYLLPVKFARYGRSSTVAGLSNAFTYLGSALSGVGIGLLVGGFSWAVVCLLLCGLCAIGTLLSLFIRPTWNRFIARGREQAARESNGADQSCAHGRRCAAGIADRTEPRGGSKRRYAQHYSGRSGAASMRAAIPAAQPTSSTQGRFL